MKRVDQLARSYTEQAVATLAAIMNNELSEDKDRIKAADSLLDRGHGKPLAATIQLPPSKLQLQILAAAGDDELLEIMRSKPLPRLGHDTTGAMGAIDAIDGEFTEVPPAPAVVLRSQILAGETPMEEAPAGPSEFPSIATERDPLLD